MIDIKKQKIKLLHNRITTLVNLDGMRTVKEIAVYTGFSEIEIRNALKTLIEFGKIDPCLIDDVIE